MLRDYLKPELIRFHVKAQDWQTAIYLGGELLVNQQICTQKYIDACIQASYDLGPYMVISPGIALAHSRPENGVLQIGMSIITLDPAINFGNKDNDPVSLLITFCGIDHNSHIGMLQELATFLMDERNQQFLFKVNTAEELITYLQDSERKM